MLNAKGTLPVGINYAGETHREFELRPALVRDSIEVLEESPRAERNRHYAGLCVYAKRLVRLGAIPKEKITGDLLLNMTEEDFAALSAAGSFRSGTRPNPPDEKGAPVDGGTAV